MFPIDSTIEFTDIVLTSPLPLDQYLFENSSLSLRLLVNGVAYSETPVVDGDRETGRWVMNAGFHVPLQSDSFKLAAIVNVGELKVQLLAIEHSLSNVMARLKERSAECHRISICEPICPIQLTMVCKIRLSSSQTGPPLLSISEQRRTIGVSVEPKSHAEERASTLSSPEELESFYPEATSLPPSDTKATVLNQTDWDYHELSKETKQKTDIEKPASIHEGVVRFTGDFHPKSADHFKHAGDALKAEFEQSRDLTDIEKAISHYEAALNAINENDSTWSSHLSDLGIALYLRFQRLGHLEDIDRAITTFQKVVEITPNDDHNKPIGLNNLGSLLRSRFERLGNITDGNSAISVCQEVIKITPDGHPDKPGRINNLGQSFFIRFSRFGSLVDIDSAILVHQEAVEITQDGDPAKPSRLSNLGNSLNDRFVRLGNLVDLDSAISAHQEAVKMTLDSHPNKPLLLNNLGIALFRRFRRLGSLIDIDSAISVHREAVKMTLDGDSDKSSRLNNLGISLRCRFERLGSLTDVDSAISVQREAVKIIPDGHPHEPGLLSSLGSSLFCRYGRLENLIDLNNAISVYKEAIKITPDDHPSKPGQLSNLGNSLLRRFEHLRSPIDIDQAVSFHREAARITPDDHPEQLLRLNNLGGSLLRRFECLGSISDVENTISVHRKADRSQPVVANRLKDIGRQLESPVSQMSTPVEDVAQRFSKLATEWDTVVEEIRRIPIFEGFLGAKSFAKLAPAASERPVVILNVHQSRSDALVLIQDESSNSKVSVVNIPLKPFVHEMSKTLLASMTGLLSAAGVRSRGIHQHESIDRHISRKIFSYETLKTLFKNLMDHLSPPEFRASSPQEQTTPIAGSDHLPRIWWCATGALSFLPIHAAGIYGTGRKGYIISDYVVSSYTPTLTAILDQSQPIVEADFQLLTVAVAQPSLPDVPPIYGTEDEVELVQNLAKAEGVQCVNLTKENATMERVVREMKESNWIHLACHGQQNINNSMESGFLLHDGILELSEIVRLSLTKADFAFLSACQTATGDEKIAEESVHLAAGMLLSGCRGVIASMWSISDKDAPKVAKYVYCGMLKDGRPNRKEPAYALHEAMKGLRESGAGFLSWVPFIHIGR